MSNTLDWYLPRLVADLDRTPWGTPLTWEGVGMAKSKRKPQLVSESEELAIGTVHVLLHKCSTCGRWMLNKSAERANNVFATEYFELLKEYLALADWRLSSDVTVGDGRVICEQCASENKGSFACALCGEVRESSQKERSVGDPPEFLCRVCYETKPAKLWDEKYKELLEAHRYDFE
jgi:hypothetical protein